MSEPTDVCDHLKAIHALKLPQKHVCSECVRIGGEWVHLRTCQTCGHTLCCDSSPHRHMTAHYHAQKHPVVISAQPGERWLWCYPDEQMIEY